MRKSVIDIPSQWLDLPALASVQVTSEADGFPVESALAGETTTGWRAAEPGEQTIRILFDTPVSIRKIQLQFAERERSRTQEFVLRWSTPDGIAREIVRQQWNFNPSGSTSETEEYRVELDNAAVLELKIKPDIGGGNAVASLASLRLA
jgi:hypothetical protein